MLPNTGLVISLNSDGTSLSQMIPSLAKVNGCVPDLEPVGRGINLGANMGVAVVKKGSLVGK